MIRYILYIATPHRKPPMTTTRTPAEILATVVELRRRARQIPKVQRLGHFQMAKRCIADAAMFAESNTAHAENRCWEARHHLNQIPAPAGF